MPMSLSLEEGNWLSYLLVDIDAIWVTGGIGFEVYGLLAAAEWVKACESKVEEDY